MRRASLWVGGMAAAGVVVAHTITYRVAAPHGPHRASLLEATGHDAWPVVSALGFGCLVAALVQFGLHRARTASTASGASLVTGLVGLQSAGWLLLEGAERTFLAHDAHALIEDPVVVIGLGIQVLVALAAALLLSLLARAVDAFVRVRARVVWAHPRSAPRPLTAVDAPIIALAASGVGLRGPPASR